MTLSKIKEELYNHKGMEATIKCDLGRNKYEVYDVTIKDLYKHIFLVKLKNNEIKSFSYSDIITKTIRINY